jgi:hypothetical protein
VWTIVPQQVEGLKRQVHACRRSGKQLAPVTPPSDVVTPVAHTKLPDEQPGSAVSTGERLQLQLQSCTTAPDAATLTRCVKCIAASTNGRINEKMCDHCRYAVRDTAAQTYCVICRPTGSPVAAAAASTPVCQALEGQQPAGDGPIPATSADSPAESPDAQHALQTPSPAVPFEAKLAAVQQAEGPLPSTGVAPAPREQGTSAASEQLQAQHMQAGQPEPLEGTAADDVEESLAAATLLELPRTKLVQPQSKSPAVQRRPMGELDPNSVRGKAAAAGEPQPQVLTKHRRKSGLLDAAWAASGIAKRPPQQKRSARRVPPAARETSPRLLSQFPQRQRLSTLPSAAALPDCTPVSIAPAAAAAVAAPALLMRPALQQPASPPPSVAVPSVSAPPPALPELPPIAPLVLQPVQLRLVAEVPPAPVVPSGSSAQIPMQTNVQLTQSSVMQRPPATQQAEGSYAARSLRPPSSRLPVKRPGWRRIQSAATECTSRCWPSDVT